MTAARVLACIFMRRTLVCVVVASALLAACGSDKKADAPASTSTSKPSGSTTDKPAATTKPAAPTTTVPSTDIDTPIKATEVATGLQRPMAVAWRKGDDRMYVAQQQPGTVRIVDNGRPGPAVLTVDVSNGNEQGLLGLDFSADGSKLYINYTDPAGDTHVVEYTMNGDRATSPRELLFVDQPYANHNGGQVLMHNGMLYVGLGDGGSAGDPQNNAQNPNSRLGKMLRINPATGRTEIWMTGLRNPWRYSFDRANGDIWIGDVGQNAYEEIDWARGDEGGINWGWSAREGKHRYSDRRADNARDPIIETSHADGNCAIVGGYVYRGAQIPGFNGVYMYSDNCTGRISLAVANNGKLQETRDLDLTVQNVTSFAEDPEGELYALDRGGRIYKFEAA